MIIQEPYSDTLVRTYSDQRDYIRQNETGAVYEEAIDIAPCRYTYSETEEKIPDPEPEPEAG